MRKDKGSIGLSSLAQQKLAEIEAKGWFNESADIARFCLAYAIRANAGLGTVEHVETRWSVGGFDKTTEIRSLIRVIYPECEAPVRQMEHLVDIGIDLVHSLVVSEHYSPTDLLTAEVPDVSITSQRLLSVNIRCSHA